MSYKPDRDDTSVRTTSLTPAKCRDCGAIIPAGETFWAVWGGAPVWPRERKPVCAVCARDRCVTTTSQEHAVTCPMGPQCPTITSPRPTRRS